MSVHTIGAVIGLREAADLVEAHPGLPVPYVAAGHSWTHVHWFLANLDRPAEEQQQVARRILSELGGDWSHDERVDEPDGPISVWERHEGSLLLHVQAQRVVLAAVPS